MSAVEERYSRAIGSSHLEWSTTEQTALDIIIAAGLPDRDKHGSIIGDSLGVGLMRLRAEFDSVSSTPRARNMLPMLKSAASVQLRLLALVLDRGSLQGQEAIDLVAKLLDQWCDPSCPACTGRGSIGAYGEPQLICNACGGSKRRTLMWSAEQQQFADEIAAEMESKVDLAQRRIRKLLKQD